MLYKSAFLPSKDKYNPKNLGKNTISIRILGFIVFSSSSFQIKTKIISEKIWNALQYKRPILREEIIKHCKGK